MSNIVVGSAPTVAKTGAVSETSLSAACTIASGQNLLIVLGDATGTMTRNGVALTRLTGTGGLAGQHHLSLWYQIDPTVGSYPVVHNFTAWGGGSVLIPVGIEGAHATAPIGLSSAVASAQYSPATDPVNCPAGGIIVSYAEAAELVAFTANAGETVIASNGGSYNSTKTVLGYKAGATSISWAWNNGGQDIRRGWVGIIPATVSTPAPSFVGPNIDNIARTVNGTNPTIATAGKFTNATSFEQSDEGTAWPSWVTLNTSTGVITVDVTQARAVSGLKVEAIGGSAPNAHSNAFNVDVASAPPSFTGTIANITRTVNGTNPTINVSGNFSGVTNYAPSAGGTAWPAWLTINGSTGVITVDVTQARATVSGLRVAGTGATPPGADSNPFSVTVNAAASLGTVSLTVGGLPMVVTNGADALPSVPYKLLFHSAASPYHFVCEKSGTTNASGQIMTSVSDSALTIGQYNLTIVTTVNSTEEVTGLRVAATAS